MSNSTLELLKQQITERAAEYTKNAQNSPIKALQSQASEYAKKFTDSSNSFALTNDVNLSNIASDISKNVSSILGGINSSLNAGGTGDIAFISNTVKDSQAMLSSMTGNLSSSLDNITKLASNSLSTLASRTGLSSITNDLDLSKAISSISNSIQNLSIGSLGITDSLSNLLNSDTSILNTITNGIDSAISNVTNSIKNIIGNVPDSITDAISSITDSVDNIINSLPNELKNKLNLDNTLTSIDLDKIISSITTNIPNLENVEDVVESLLSSSDSNYFNILKDEQGNTINGTDRTNYNTYSQLIRLANSLCGSSFTVKDYSFDKNLFDILLKALLDNGLSDILKQLSNCNQYFDDRSENIIKASIPVVAYNGDVNTLSNIVDIVGSGNITDIDDTMLTVATNMTTADSFSDLDDLSTKISYDLNDLFYTANLGDEKILDGFNTSLLYSSGVSKRVLGSDLTNKTIILTDKYLTA